MNLSEERNYQKLLDTLAAMGLSEGNRQLAERYFEPGTDENEALLSQAERENFYQLPEEDRRKCWDYAAHLKKRGSRDALARFVHFAAAAGGSTACYVLTPYAYFGWSVKDLQEYMTKPQSMAVRAELTVWNQYSLNWPNLRELQQEIAKNPADALRAMELCYNQYDNAKVLLAALYLYKRTPRKESRGLINGLLGAVFGDKSRKAEDASGTADGAGAGKPSAAEGDGAGSTAAFLVSNLIDSLPAVCSPQITREDEKKILEDYVRRGRPYGPLPQEVYGALRGKQAPPYLLTLLSGCAFLAQEHSPSLLAFLQVMSVLHPENTLNACRQMSEPAYFKERLPVLEKILPVGEPVLVEWYVKSRTAEGLRRMAAQCPEIVLAEALKPSTGTEEYQFISEQVRQANPALFQRMNREGGGEYMEKLLNELTADTVFQNGREEAKRYLRGEAPADSLYPFAYSWRGGYGYYARGFQTLKTIRAKDSGLYERALVLEALKAQGAYFAYEFLPRGRDSLLMKEKIEELIKILERGGLSIQYIADAMEGIYSSYYSEQDKNHFLDGAVNALARRFMARREEFLTALKNSTSVGRDICLRVLDVYWEKEKDAILACAQDSSKQVRATLALICAGHRAWEPEMLAFLSSKKGQERELAVRVLKSWGAEAYQEELRKALETEKSKGVRELLLTCVESTEGNGGAQGASGVPAGSAPSSGGGAGAPGAGGTAACESPEALAARVLKGGKKRKVSWAFETPFSQVHRTNGEPASEDYLAAILAAYADRTAAGPSPEAARLAGALAGEELFVFARELFDKWLSAGAEAKKKWVLYAASIHGGEGIVPLFKKQIEEWPQHARGAMAAEAVKALALNGSAQALLLVDQISRKFKFRQVKEAAGSALDEAAVSLGVSRAELEDRIVPDLGFGEDMGRTFDYGPRSFQVYLTPALELEVFDSEKKRLKNMPAPGKRDDTEKAAAAYEAFKQLKKQVKTVAANQRLRLEQALTAERLWRAGAWRELFVKNPVMHQFAIGLIWGVYENGALKDTFRYMEDGSFNTVDEEEYDFPEEGMIGLIHPIELTGEDLASWKEQLADYEVVQPIEQLSRPVYRVTEEEKGKMELARFGGMLINGLSLSGKLQAMGWYRGSVQDAGVYTTFYREDGEIGVELEFSGSYVGDENEEVTVYGAAFYRAGTVKRGSYVYDTIKAGDRYALDAVPPRYFSETVLQLTKATAASKERLEYPACRE